MSAKEKAEGLKTKWLKNNCALFPEHTALRVAAQIEEAFLLGCEHARPKWISVEDRLPKMHEEVLVFGDVEKGLFIHIAALDEDTSENSVWWNGDPYHYMPGHITHWMPLPTWPEGEG